MGKPFTQITGAIGSMLFAAVVAAATSTPNIVSPAPDDVTAVPTRASASVAPSKAVPANTARKRPVSDVKKTAGKHQAASKPTRYMPDRFAGRAREYYGLVWGIDSISVQLVESGELVRFSYRVLDARKAQVLNDKQSAASLVDARAGVSLVVPTMEKVGQLRQSATPEPGRSYWMAFSNKGRPVKRGDHVDVVVGTFKASNLVVD